MTEQAWIAVTSAREGIDVVEALTRRRISATLVIGRDGYRVRVGARTHDLPAVLRAAALAVERAREDAPFEAA